jgi:hypothetical protein
MTDRELWVKTWKTVGAMVGGTVVFLGSVSLVLLLGWGRRGPPAAPAETTPTPGQATPGAKETTPPLPNVPPTLKGPRHSIAASTRPGESI